MKRPLPTPRRKRPLPYLEELEPRHLFSVDTAVLGMPMALLAADAAQAESVVVQAASSSAIHAKAATLPAAVNERREVVFVDAGIDDARQLIDSLKQQDNGGRQVDVVWIGKDEDGIKVITDYLKGRSGLDAVHIISHGDRSGIQLGNVFLDQQMLEQNAAPIS